jgi:ketosteroid isomerase-like protein
MLAPSDEDIDLLAGYAAAFARRDLEAACDVYALPATLMSAQGAKVLQTRDELRASFTAAWAGYTAQGVAETDLEFGQALELGEDLRQVEARWHVRRGDGSTLWRFTTWYVLWRSPEGWRVRVAITTQGR